MAVITLSRPDQWEKRTVQSATCARIVLSFPAEQADMEKAGDDLVFAFEDGGSVTLEDFYRHHAESIPEFQVDGRIIAGADFFRAFGPHIAPAAGPGGSRHHADDGMNPADSAEHPDDPDWWMHHGVRYEAQTWPTDPLYSAGEDIPRAPEADDKQLSARDVIDLYPSYNDWMEWKK